MLVSITIDVDSSTAAERYAEIRRLLILADLLAARCESGRGEEQVARSRRNASMRGGFAATVPLNPPRMNAAALRTSLPHLRS